MATIPMIDYQKQSYDIRVDEDLDFDEDGLVLLDDLYNYVSTKGDAFNLTNDETRNLMKWIERSSSYELSYEQLCLLIAKVKHQFWRSTAFRAAQMVLPKRERDKAFSYIAQYNCCPPPIFIAIATIAEIAVYAYYATVHETAVTIGGPVPGKTVLIYDPCKRYQVWRFLSYALIHVGVWHLIVNCLVQIVLGIPLELVHKLWRVGLIYICGIAAGSLAVSMTDTKAYLAGASGGGYAIIAAHVANLLINWSEMEYAPVRAVILAILISTDVGVAIYNRYAVNYYSGAKVHISYAAHFGGFVTGILLGIVVLRNLRYKRWEKVAIGLSIGILSLLFLCSIFWNIFTDGLREYCTQ